MNTINNDDILIGPIVKEVHSIFSPSIIQSVRIYSYKAGDSNDDSYSDNHNDNDNYQEKVYGEKADLFRHFIEFEHNVDLDADREMITRFNSDIASDGIMFTAENGLEIKPR